MRPTLQEIIDALRCWEPELAERIEKYGIAMTDAAREVAE